MSLQVLSLLGERVIVEGYYLYIHLYSGPYFKAWRDYQWKEKRPALGVNRSILHYAKDHGLKIRVIVSFKSDRAYEADPSEWLKFSENTQSIDEKNSVLICLLPWSPTHFETIHGDFSHILRRLGYS